MKKIILLLIAFAIGDCVHIKPKLWWTWPTMKWTIIGTEKGKYVLYDGQWTVHGVPAKLMEKCK